MAAKLARVPLITDCHVHGELQSKKAAKLARVPVITDCHVYGELQNKMGAKLARILVIIQIVMFMVSNNPKWWPS